MPIVDFEGSTSPLAAKLKDVCDAYGVELFAGLMESRRVMVRTMGRGALGTLHVDDLEHLESRLRSWGLRPLDEDGRMKLAAEVSQLEPQEVAPYDVVFAEPPSNPDPVLDEIERDLANLPDYEDPLTEARAASEQEQRRYNGDPAAAPQPPPWAQTPPPEWFTRAIEKSSEEPIERDGVLCIGFDVIDLAKVSRVGWEPRDETWNEEVPEQYRGILHLYLDGTRISLPETEENARTLTVAWVRLTARRNMHGSTV